jgi:hypothetical protein
MDYKAIQNACDIFDIHFYDFTNYLFTIKQIKTLYRQKSRICHPDKSHNNDLFVALHDAHIVLLDFLASQHNTHSNIIPHIIDFHKIIHHLSCIKNEVYKGLDFKQHITIYPNIKDSFQHNIIVITHDKLLYYCPSWQSEITYAKIIVKCDIILPNNIFIDSVNNVHAHIKPHDEHIIYGVDKTFINPICDNNLFIYKNQGIPTINNLNVYDNNIIGDVIFHLV